MNEHLLRGILLLQQCRPADAEVELRRAVLDDPQSATAHATLARCLVDLKRYDDAEREARESIRCGPLDAESHSSLASVLFARNRNREAEAAIRESLRLDSTDADSYGLLALIQCNLRDFKAALETAETGLSYDATHVGCTTARTLALIHTGSSESALEQSAAALHHDPQDFLAHSGRGWALLHENRPKEALTAFREALRLEPGFPWAREGLVESLKAQNWFYRQLLQYFLWMSRLPLKLQFALIIGLMVLQGVFSGMAKSDSVLKPVGLILLIACLGFVVITWIAKPLFNLLLMTNRFGRAVLYRAEKWQAGLIGIWIVVIVALTIAAFQFDEFLDFACGFTAFSMTLSLLPLMGAFNFNGKRRWAMIALTVAILGLQAASTICIIQADGFMQSALEQERLLSTAPTPGARQGINIAIDWRVKEFQSLFKTALELQHLIKYIALGAMVLTNVFVAVPRRL